MDDQNSKSAARAGRKNPESVLSTLREILSTTRARLLGADIIPLQPLRVRGASNSHFIRVEASKVAEIRLNFTGGSPDS